MTTNITPELEKARASIAALLADDGRTPEEAEQARKMAVRLMAKHGLTEADIKASAPNMGKAAIEIGRHDWLLYKAVAFNVERLTGARIFTRELATSNGKRSDRKLVTIMGFQSDVEWAYWLLGHLIEASKRSAAGSVSDRQRSDRVTGFGIAVGLRLRALADEMATHQTAAPSGTALVEVKSARVNDFLVQEGIVLGVSKAKSRDVKDAAGFQKGLVDGSKVSLGRPISKSGGPGVLAIGA